MFVKVKAVKEGFEYLVDTHGMRVGFVYEFEGDELGATFTSLNGAWELDVSENELTGITLSAADTPPAKLDQYLMDKWWEAVVSGATTVMANKLVSDFKELRRGELFIK